MKKLNILSIVAITLMFFGTMNLNAQNASDEPIFQEELSGVVTSLSSDGKSGVCEANGERIEFESNSIATVVGADVIVQRYYILNCALVPIKG